MYLIKIILITIILTSLNNKVVGQNLISVHSVADSTEMNSITPETGSIIFLESTNQNYQYSNGTWLSLEANTISESLLIDSANSYVSSNNCCPFYEIGDTIDCGVVVHTYNNGSNGTICAFEDLPDDDFGCGMSVGFSSTDGLSNSMQIESACPNSAAAACLNYDPCGGGGWYLPARDELQYAFNNIYLINYVLFSLNLTPLDAGISTSLGEGAFYWSSTSVTANQAYVMVMGDYISASPLGGGPGQAIKEKNIIDKVRPFKQF